jgi:putative ABC transport system permease protein
MRWSFLRIAIRLALRKKEQAIVKILGLAVGIGVCLLIFIVVRFETSFDDFHLFRDHTYRVVSAFATPQGIAYQSAVPFPTASALRRDFPQLKQVASIVSLGSDNLITVVDSSDASLPTKKFREETGVLYAEPQFFDMFSFPWLAGDKKTALTEPNTVLLTRSMAAKYFGTWTLAIGRYLKLDNNWHLKVTGVLEDIPSNTDFPLKVVISYATLRNTGVSGYLNNWVSIFAQHYCFVTLPDNLSEATFNKDLTQVVNRYKPLENRNEGMMLQPLRDMHFDTRFNTFNNHPFSRALIRTFSLIGLFVLIIACMNFVNLSTAQAVNRSQEVGMRKVLGGTRRQLLWQFMAETCLLVLIATVVAVGLCNLTLPFFNRLLGMQLDSYFILDPAVGWMLITVVAATTFLAGFYPSVVLSGFNPVRAFKTKGAPRDTGSHLLRRTLVVLQFTIAQALIICVLIIIGQVDYFRSAPMGFDKDAILITHLPDNKKMGFLRQQLLKTLGVEKVSFSFASPIDVNSDWNSDIVYNGVEQHDFGVNLKWADSVYPNLYHFQLLAGSIFPGPYNMVVNEAFLRKLGIHQPKDALGAKVVISGIGDTSFISGVVRDFNIAPLQDTIRPVVIESWDRVYSTINIKLTPLMIGRALPEIEKFWKATFPDDVYEYRFLNESIARYYEQEDQLSSMYKVFASLAILISCLGLYSLVSFMAATRAREIAIRKILGASVAKIVYLFSHEFTLLVLLSFLIAAPLAGYFMQRWLENYAFHFHPRASLFVEAIGISVAIALASVGYRAVKAANSNPVVNLRSE